MKSLSKFEGPQQATPYPLSRLSPPINLPELLKNIEDSNKSISNVVNGKLQVIIKQIDFLQKEALQILENAKRDCELHNIPCGFLKRAGQVYFLYQRVDGSKFFSIISPNEWGSMIPGSLEGSYQLESDMSWKEVDGNG